MNELIPEEIAAIQQEISALADQLKDKQGQVHSCACMLNIEVNEKNVKENKTTMKYMSLYIQEYINLADNYLQINNLLYK